VGVFGVGIAVIQGGVGFALSAVGFWRVGDCRWVGDVHRWVEQLEPLAAGHIREGSSA